MTQELHRVFISFQYEDLHYASLMDAWCANDNDEFDMYNERLKVAVNSRDADYIKQRIRPKINRASVLMCLIGGATSKSDWVNWEIATAKQKSSGLVGVELKSGNAHPTEINDAGAVFVPYQKEQILKAIAWAATSGKISGDYRYR